LEAGVKVAAGLQVEELAHVLATWSYLKVVDWMMGIWRGSPLPGV
jgi:hypothetical protein